MNKGGTPANLVNPATRPKDQRVALARKAGSAPKKALRRKRDLKTIVGLIAQGDVTDTKARQQLKDLGLTDDDLKNSALIAQSLYNRARDGDIRAIEAWSEYEAIGLEAAQDDAGKELQIPAVLIGKAFVDINRHIEPGKTYVFAGGRGSLKSTYVSEKCIELLENNPDMHMVVIRKIQATLRDSVYEQLKWAIEALGVGDHYKCTVSPMSIKNTVTGQRIYFRGLDDPTKLKSIKPPFGYVGMLWVEEADQIAGEAELRNVKQSCLRGGEGYTFISYNPPKSRSAWVNQYAADTTDENKVVHRSCYTDAPPEWLGAAFLEEAEHLKQTNPTAYAHEYGGEATGDGGNVFDNIEIREITDEEIARCDHIFQGNDWGYSPDPLAFIRLNYDRTREEILLIDEIVALKWSNHQAAEEIKRRGYTDTYITCDSAEKKSTADYRSDGLPARNAIKGPDSVRYGLKWLAARKIIIDPKRTPHAYKEFTRYEHERDREGNPISGYPDKDNHTIDAVRYALECIWRLVYYKA